MKQKVLLADQGAILKFNNYAKQFDIATATLEDFVTLAIRAATVETEGDYYVYVNTAVSHLDSIPIECKSPALGLFLNLVTYIKSELARIGWYKPGLNYPVHFGGFVGATTDYILIGG